MTPPPDIRERLAKLGPFTGERSHIYAGRTCARGWCVGYVVQGLPDVPHDELAALIAKLLNQYVATKSKEVV